MAKAELRLAPDERAAATDIWTRTRRALAGAWRWLDRHEQPPEPFDGGHGGRAALAVVAVMALAYTVVVTRYLIALHNSFGTTAEDLGIMDQVLWNTAHGHFMAETICNPITDTNCLGVVSRFAIHFEPILIPLSLLYRVVANVRLLLLLQVAAAASGAFPAYLLATRRLRHVLWGVTFSLLFLLYPALQAAVLDAFHPETLAAPLLMWALYFLSVRRYRTLLAVCCVALLCKETLALDVIAIGLFVVVIQRRRWQGARLCALGVAALVLALALMRLTSPLGHSPVAGRLSGLTHDPLHTLALLATDPNRRSYLLKLLAPAGFLPLLSPWTLAIGLPSIVLNLVSSDPLMYSGGYQYNSDIVPVLIAAAIDALVWLRPICLRLVARAARAWRGSGFAALAWRKGALWAPVLALAVVLPVMGLSSQAYVAEAYRAITLKDPWPIVTAHDRIGSAIARAIPPGASLSAQAALVPHVSERLRMYQYPVAEDSAQYVFLDVTAGNFYPFTSESGYVNAIDGLLNSCRFSVAAAEDGYLLLRRLPASSSGVAPCHLTLPAAFYSFAYAKPPGTAAVTPATFGNTLELVGYERVPSVVSSGEPWMVVTTYWRVLRPVSRPLTVALLVTLPSGVVLDVSDSVTQDWLPPSAWTPGTVVRVQTWPLYLGPLTHGSIAVSAQVRAGAPATRPAPDAALAPMPAPPTSGSGRVVAPHLTAQGMAVLLATIPVR